MSADQIDVWIGTNGPHGIHYFVLDTEKGEMTEPSLAADQSGSGFLVLNEKGDTLYATGRKDGNVGYVAAYSVSHSKDGKSVLKLRNKQDTGDSGSSHINLDRTGSVVMTAQYGGSSIAIFPLADDGSVEKCSQLIKHQGGSGVVGKVQDNPHPHWIGASPNNSLVYVPDLGMDQVVVYKLDTKNATLTENSKLPLAPGAGPRHMKFDQQGNFAYVLNELNLTVTVFAVDEAKASFKEIQTIDSLPEELKDKHLNSAAEIRIHPNGKFVYTSSRGHDSITVFSVDAASGKLAFLQRESIRGSWPRNFNIDPSGKWLLAAGSYSNTVSLFEIEDSGKLTFTRNIVNIPKPICVVFGSRHDSSTN